MEYMNVTKLVKGLATLITARAYEKSRSLFLVLILSIALDFDLGRTAEVSGLSHMALSG
jgi:hypothetical protein